MCGLVAVLKPGNAVDGELLARMRDALAHRGPDAALSWHEQAVGLGHRRLAVVDTSHEADQPMLSEDGRHVIVFNGEIYNFIELREELRRADHVFRTASDTEVLLTALRHWGDEALPRLNGMFAFALWDRRERTLLVARDRFGEKPLFMTRQSDGGVAFASEMKALLVDPATSDAIDYEIMEAFTKSAYFEERAHTFYKAIERLPAASAMLLSGDGRALRSWRYWTPDYEAIDASLPLPEAQERFAELLSRSITMRLRADVPIGSSLSGGLDSSVIVGALAAMRGEQSFEQHTFSARFPEDPTLSEGEYIDAVVQHTGVCPHSVAPDPITMASEIEALHHHQEEPLYSASIYLQWCVARVAKENGTIVLLDGQGADELLGGYQFYYKAHQLDLIDRGRYDEAARVTRLFNERLASASQTYANAERRFNAKVAYSFEELEAMRKNPPPPWRGDYSVGVPRPLPGMRVRRTMAEAMQWNSLPLLLRYADRNSMAFSREGRLPYLDYDLVDFCISQPDALFFADGWQKHCLRQYGDPLLPHSVVWRRDKVGYAAPLDAWMRGPIKDWCYERAFSGRITDLPFYDRAAVKALWDAHQSGVANNSWAVWRWISLNTWLDLHARRAAERTVPHFALPDARPAAGGVFDWVRQKFRFEN